MPETFSGLGPPQAALSELCSRATPLGADETWTSEWELAGRFNSITVVGATDVAGTVYIEFSNDRVNVDSSLPFPVAVGKPILQRLTVLRIFCRVRYVNGSTAQTYLRLQTLLGEKALLSSPLHLSVGRTADAVVVKSFNASNLIALGLVDGFTSDTKFGVNPDIGTSSDPEDVWNGGDDYTGFPTGSAETVEVFSSDAADASAGTGARTVRLTGLDADWEEQTVDVTMNGTTAVATTETWQRLNRMHVLTAGSGEENAGDITARHTTTTANVFATMPAGANQTTIAAFTVPAGKTMLIKRVAVQMGRNTASGSATVSLRVRPTGGVFRKRREFQISVGNGVDRAYETGILVEAQSDVKVRVDEVTANNTAVSAEFEYILFDNV